MTTEIITLTDVRRQGRTILVGQYTATEGHDGLPTLVIRHRGKVIKRYRGSSLGFGKPLTDEDKNYLISLATN